MNQCNVLGVCAKDSIIKFFANGGFLSEIKDPSPKSGFLGLFADDSDNLQNIVEFDNVYKI